MTKAAIGKQNSAAMKTFAEDVMDEFSERLRQAREKAGYKTAKAFADIIQVEAPTYRQWERGEASPDLQSVTRLCRALKVQPNDLLPLALADWTPGKSVSRKRRARTTRRSKKAFIQAAE